MRTAAAQSIARKRILKTAQDLFYRNGYKATGINEIIKKSDVAKATFYAHFPSKEDLALAYVKAMNDAEAQMVQDALKKYSGPYEKLIGLFKFSIPWSEERAHRGCAYLNIATEFTDHTSPVRQESKTHYEMVRRLVEQLVRELKKDPHVADDFMLLFAGALSLAQIYHDSKPYQAAIAASKRLLK